MSLAELFYAKHPRRPGPSAERRRRRKPKARKALFEAIEPRLLLSADLLPAVSIDPSLSLDPSQGSLTSDATGTTGTPSAPNTVVVTDLATTAPPENAPAPSTNQIVFIDPSVEHSD